MAGSRGTRLGAVLGFGGLVLLVISSMKAETKAATSGIEGTARVSPVQGGPTRLGETDSAPMANISFRVESAAGVVATFKTDGEGNFKVELPPGRYGIKIQQPQMKGRGCALDDVEVKAGDFKKVTLNCDSGIR
jgi:hypothetical protein